MYLRFGIVIWVLKFAVISLLVAVSSWGADSATIYAQEEPPPRFQFAQTDPLVLSWTALKEESVEVEVVNNTTKKLDGLKVTLSDLGLNALKDGSSENSKIKNSEALMFDPSLSLAPAGSSKVTIRAVEPFPELVPDEYSGSISVSESDTDTVTRRGVQLTVENPKSVPEPLVEDWTVRAYRILPLFDVLREVDESPILFVDEPVRLSGQSLPLNAKAEDKNQLDLMKNERLGFVEGGPGSAAVVSSTGEAVTMSDDVLGLKLAFDGLGRPGKYEGKLDFDPEDDETVALTVDVKDLVLWPILALLSGILIGTRAKRYLGKSRKVLALQEREAQVGTEINEAQKRFSKEAGRKPYADYDLKEDFDKRRANIREKLDRLARSSLVTLNDSDPDYQTLTKDLAQLETGAKEWKKFGSELVALEAALKSATASVKDASRPSDWPNEPRTEEPTFLPEARKLLRSKKLTVESSESQPGADNSFVSQRGKVKQATALARSWGTMNDLVGKCMGRVKELESRKGRMSAAQRLQLGRAKGVLSEAQYELWHAKNSDELKSKTTEQDLNDAERNLLQLLPLLAEQAPPDGEQDVAAEPMMLETALNQVKSIVAKLDSDGLDVAKTEPPEDVARASSYADAREKADWRLWWLAVGLALVTGLGALYIGKPFGTFWDYLSAVAWGVGAVLALSALNAALEGLPSPRELLGSFKTPQ